MKKYFRQSGCQMPPQNSIFSVGRERLKSKPESATKQNLGGGFRYVLFSPLLGGKISILTNIFQLGGSTTN